MTVASPAPMIAAAMAAARRRLLTAFREADAHSPDTAIPYGPQRRMERRYFYGLLDFGALIEAKPGFYYLDEAKLAEHTARRRKRAFAMFGGVIAVGAALFGLSQL